MKETSMRLTARSLSLLATLLLVFSSNQQAMAANGDLLSTDKTNVNVRSTPSTSGEIVTRVKPGEMVIEIESTADWYRVRLPSQNREGWVYAPLMSVVRSPAAQPGAVARAPAARAPIARAPGARAPIAQAPAARAPIARAPAARAPIAQAPIARAPAALAPAARAPIARAPARAPSNSFAPSSDRLLARLDSFDERLVGNARRGEALFAKCGSCHTTVPGVHADGPSLSGVFGRRPAQAQGFEFSGAMQAFAREGKVWDTPTLDLFIQRPPRVVKGTSMPFSGLRDAQDRRDVIAFLQKLR